MIILKIIDRKLSEITVSMRSIFERAGFIETFPPVFIKSNDINGFRFLFENSVYVLEPDITESLLDEKFKDSPKIYYIARQADIYLRETLKFGAEYLLNDKFESSIQILKLIIKTLDNLGISDFNIDISTTDVFQKYKSYDNGKKIMHAISTRNYYELDNLNIDNSEKEKILKIMNTRSGKSGIEFLDKIVEAVDDSRIVTDPGTVRQQEYYSGLIFEIYGKNGFIGGGGNYKIRNRNACGFSINLETIYKLYRENEVIE